MDVQDGDTSPDVFYDLGGWTLSVDEIERQENTAGRIHETSVLVKRWHVD
jgi:hypothetical protein